MHKKGAGTHMSNRNVKCIHEVLVHIPPKMMQLQHKLRKLHFIVHQVVRKKLCRTACKEFAMAMPGKLDKDNEFLRKIIFSKLHFKFWGKLKTDCIHQGLRTPSCYS